MAIIGSIGLIGLMGPMGMTIWGDLFWIVSSVGSCFVHLLFNASVLEEVLL